MVVVIEGIPVRINSIVCFKMVPIIFKNQSYNIVINLDLEHTQLKHSSY